MLIFHSQNGYSSKFRFVPEWLNVFYYSERGLWIGIDWSPAVPLDENLFGLHFFIVSERLELDIIFETPWNTSYIIIYWQRYIKLGIYLTVTWGSTINSDYIFIKIWETPLGKVERRSVGSFKCISDFSQVIRVWNIPENSIVKCF